MRNYLEPIFAKILRLKQHFGYQMKRVNIRGVHPLLMEENFTLHLFLPEYCWPLNNAGVRGADPLHSWKSTCNFTVSPLHPQSLCICHLSVSADSVNHGSFHAIELTSKKEPHISGPMQLKPVLFQESTVNISSWYTS